VLEKINDARYRLISQPSAHALDLARRVLDGNHAPLFCEVGIGIGATSIELCRLLAHRGEIWFFDFEDKLAELTTDLRAAGFDNFRTFGNSRRTYDSYGWTLAMELRRMRERGQQAGIDFAYLDGAHTFFHDAPATVCLKEMVKPGGYLLMDDYDWTIAVSPSMRPTVNPSITRDYTDEQIELSHVEMVCALLFDNDHCFERVDIGYRRQEHRRAYRRRLAHAARAAE
jgi:predicted O-methyltransferase YrrM